MKVAHAQKSIFVTKSAYLFILFCTAGWFGGSLFNWAWFALLGLVSVVFMMVKQVKITDEIALCEDLLEERSIKTARRNRLTARLLITTLIVAVAGLFGGIAFGWDVYALALMLLGCIHFVRLIVLLDEWEWIENRLTPLEDL